MDYEVKSSFEELTAVMPEMAKSNLLAIYEQTDTEMFSKLRADEDALIDRLKVCRAFWYNGGIEIDL